MKAERRDRNSRGQALVEWALIAPVILVVFLGAVQVGAIVYSRTEIESAAREGARIAVIKPVESGAYLANGSPTNTTCPTSGSSTNPACKATWNGAGFLSENSLNVNISAPGGTQSPCSTSGTPPPNPEPSDGAITLSVSASVPVFVPFVRSVFGGTNKQISTSVTMRVEPCFFTNGT